MTTKKIIARIIIIGVILAGIAYFLRGCGKDNSENKSLQDSLNISKHITDSLNMVTKKASIFVDSVVAKGIADSIRYTGMISQRDITIKFLKSDLNKKKDSVTLSFKNLKKFYLEHDTIALVETYNRMQQQLEDENNQIFHLSLYRDSTEIIMKAEIDSLREEKNSILSALGEFKKAYIAEARNTQSLTGVIEKQIRKEKRKKILNAIEKVGAAVLGIIVGKKL